LLAMLIAAMLTAHGVHLRQIRDAGWRREALVIADELLSSWFNNTPPDVPRDRIGRIDRPTSSWRWRTSTIERQSIGRLQYFLVRLEVAQYRDDAPPGPPMCILDVVVPVPREAEVGGR
jgi:hypothetical protein